MESLRVKAELGVVGSLEQDGGRNRGACRATGCKLWASVWRYLRLDDSTRPKENRE